MKFTHLFRKTIFCLSAFKKPGAIQPLILLNDCHSPMNSLDNILITDIHEGDLHGPISDLLKKKYLGVC